MCLYIDIYMCVCVDIYMCVYISFFSFPRTDFSITNILAV